MEVGYGDTGKNRRRIAVAVLGGLVVLVLLIDLGVARRAVPDIPQACPAVEDTTCQAKRSDAVQARIVRANELEDGLDARSWIYASVFVLGVVGIAAYSVRAGQDLGDVAADLGVVGVAWLLIAALLFVTTSGGSGLVQPPTGRLSFVAAALLVIAAIGATAARVTGGGRPREAPEATWVVVTGLALTVLTVVMASTQLGGPSGCEALDDWSGVTLWIAIASTVGAIFCGLVCLLWRRWFAALVCVTVAPFALLMGVLANACFN